MNSQDFITSQGSKYSYGVLHSFTNCAEQLIKLTIINLQKLIHYSETLKIYISSPLLVDK